MFWTTLLLTALTGLLIKLGATSVIVSILSMGLKAAAIIIAILVALLLWKNYLSHPVNPLNNRE